MGEEFDKIDENGGGQVCGGTSLCDRSISLKFPRLYSLLCLDEFVGW